MAVEEKIETFLYRHFCANGVLLYVGVSLSVPARLAQHNAYSKWAKDIRSVTVESFPSRESALAAETAAIRVEKPLFNIAKTKAPKLAQQFKDVESHKAESSAARLMDRVVNFSPLYSRKDLAEVFKVSIGSIGAMWDRGDLGFITIEGRSKRATTGWQIIEYFEAKMSQQMEV